MTARKVRQMSAMTKPSQPPAAGRQCPVCRTMFVPKNQKKPARYCSAQCSNISYARGNLGSGALTIAQQRKAVEMLLTGLGQRAVAAHFKVTKNTIAGVWHRSGNGKPASREPTTLYERCDALEAAMERVLDATLGVGRVPNAPREKHNSPILLPLRVG